MNSSKGWRPTPAHFRAIAGSLALGLGAVVGRRPDLLVLAAPLVVAVVWAVARRPTRAPAIRERVSHPALWEGQATRWRVEIDDPEGHVEDVAVAFESPRLVDQQPRHGHVAVSLPDDGPDGLAVHIRPTRWGSHRLQPTLVVASSAWNGFRFVSKNWTAATDLLAFPHPVPFDATAPAVRTPGLVGVNRSPREGSGTEFASVRPFQPGDRLRRIHWVESLRSGTLHVTSTWADHDRLVILVIDAYEDVGRSGGVDGASSSLDVAVRAGAAIAEHYISVGDRVGVLPLGVGVLPRLGSGSGRRHLRRILELLARVHPIGGPDDTGRMPRGLDHDALVIVLSPLLSAGSHQRLMTIADHGFTVVGIDCLPTLVVADDLADPIASNAWRLARLQREPSLRRVAAAGVPVVQWRGPGSLDEVLRGLSHRSAPRARHA